MKPLVSLLSYARLTCSIARVEISELGTQRKSHFHVEENDPLSAVAGLRRTQTMSRDAWQIRVETQMRLSSAGTTFLLRGSLRAWEGANEVCRRDWDRFIYRDLL